MTPNRDASGDRRPPSHPGVELRLWSGVAPGSEDWRQREEVLEFGGEDRVRNVVVPTLTAFAPPGAASGRGVLVAPGGGFHMLSWHSEGVGLARWFASRGVTAFVLKYRLAETGPTREDFERALATMAGGILAPEDQDSGRSLVPGIDPQVVDRAVADGRRAVRVVRERAAEFGIDAGPLAMVGFSAGGVVTAQAAVSEDREERPDLAVVLYGGALSGPVPDTAPPALFIAAADDPLLSMLTGTHAAWLAARRPAELHLYERGGHGFGVNRRRLPVDGWPERMWEWLGSHGFLRPGSAGA